MSKKHTTISEDTFKSFQFYGYLLGGMVPVAVFLSFEVTAFQNLMDQHYLVSFIVWVLVATIISLFLYNFESTKYKKLYGYTATAQAICSFLLIHMLVLYTGGPKSSVFALSYLYLIAVVGYTYGFQLELYGAAFLLFISFVLNLFFLDSQQAFFNFIMKTNILLNRTTPQGGIITSSYNNELIYFLVFLTHGLVTVFTAPKRNKDNTEDSK